VTSLDNFGDGVPTTAAEDAPLKTADVYARLRARFAGKGWALLTEVRDSTGYSGHGRSADAVALDLWPSRGNELHGFEIKVSRSDWLKELRSPAKAEAVARFADRWWIVAGAKNIVRIDELPATWGLLVPAKDGGLRVARQAPLMTPEPMTRGFIASLFRRVLEAAEQEPPDITKVREKAHAAGYEEGVTSQRYRVERAEADLRLLTQRVQAFEKESGIRLDDYNAGRIGTAVRTLMNGADPLRAIEDAERSLTRALRALEAERKAIAYERRLNEVQRPAAAPAGEGKEGRTNV
jgi:hypothetical protein